MYIAATSSRKWSGLEEKAPYDRIIYTTASFDLPACFYDQLKNEGILLIVLKLPGGGDLLIQLKKAGDHFEAMTFSECKFIKMAGKYRMRTLEPVILQQLPEWQDLQHQELSRSSFWWGGPSDVPFNRRTSAFRFFLGITETGLRVFGEEKSPDEFDCIGTINSEKTSLTLMKDRLLITYGRDDSRLILMDRLHTWFNLGMPGATHYKLVVYQSEKGCCLPHPP